MNNNKTNKRPASPPANQPPSQKQHTTTAINNAITTDKAERMASRFDKWKRPKLSQAYLSYSTNILFQELEVDYVIGESHKEFLPDSSSGPAAIIRMFGVTKEGHSVCCNVHGFEPYFYASCPKGTGPDDIARFHKILEGRMREANRNSNVPKFVRRVEMVLDKSIMDSQQQGPRPFLKIVVALPTMVADCCRILDRGIQIDGLDMKNFVTYEGSILFAIRFMIDCKIVGGNWIEVLAGKYKKTSKSLSYYGELFKLAPFRILSFDIECPVRGKQVPEATLDPVIQVANMVTLQGESEPLIRNVMTLKSCSPIDGVDVMSFDTEREVLLAWRDLIREVDPDIIIGFNICRFDLPHLIKRAEVLGIADFPILGRVRNRMVCVSDATFFSRKYGIMKSKEVTMEGRVQIDLLQAMHRDHLLESYKLNDVSAHFLGEQDAYLPQQLLDKLMYIHNYVEMARVTGVPISCLLSKGQSIKVTSQRLSKAKELNLVIPTAEQPGTKTRNV
ncbi:Dna polymerase delta catalytic subunit [Heracleum sosnowskyi]|uniref:DNA polymerase delta catalytic subunit n=1 Tax=Heracleum sosnowskyi TaxID=360622 RepID=A0AAD8HQE6_9APIA|nr:Dna polymerase delta catalytic subunit [Heracleum sosnowskyi]